MSLDGLLKKNSFKSSFNLPKQDFSYAEFLAAVPEGKYFVVLKSYDKVRVGIYADKKFSFAKEEEICAEDIVELHIFNNERELLLKRMGKHLRMRHISDVDGIASVASVDSSSEFFGKIEGGYVADADFIHLYEPGRNIALDIPNVGESENSRYELATRSYIAYDNQTGQAGFSCYRYLAIKKGGKE